MAKSNYVGKKRRKLPDIWTEEEIQKLFNHPQLRINIYFHIFLIALLLEAIDKWV